MSKMPELEEDGKFKNVVMSGLLYNLYRACVDYIAFENIEQSDDEDEDVADAIDKENYDKMMEVYGQIKCMTAALQELEEKNDKSD